MLGVFVREFLGERGLRELGKRKGLGKPILEVGFERGDRDPSALRRIKIIASTPPAQD